ncbi:hypothetical protein GOODEAATRI_010745, partial [Goodea atripinnis]
LVNASTTAISQFAEPERPLLLSRKVHGRWSVGRLQGRRCSCQVSLLVGWTPGHKRGWACPASQP